MPGERTEQATPRRREKARKDGDVLRSRELASAAGTLAGVLCLGVLGHKIVSNFRSAFVDALNLGSPDRWEPSSFLATLLTIRRLAIMTMAPVGVVAAAIVGGAALSGIVQTGGLQINAGLIGIRLDRLNPASNLKNLFSLRAASRLGKSLVPGAVLAILAIQRIAHELAVPAFSTARIEALSSDIYGVLATTAWLLLIWAFIDFILEWRNRESRLMMSREEIRQEFKESEGSPQVRSRIRTLQRQMRRRKVKADVAKAAVVLTNPTHYAVALGFDFTTMDAPRLLAKGRNLLAEEIKADARWAGVPIIENPPLARSLYRSVEVGQSIPVDLYAAVAAILAYLYRQRVETEMRERRRERRVSEQRTTKSGEQDRTPARSSLSSSPHTAPSADSRSDGGRL
jgi:flagellar biosynthesis protein FlhB